MGAGTGDLNTANDVYQVTLNFDPPNGIDVNDPCYERFRRALDWFLLSANKLGNGASGQVVPNTTIMVGSAVLSLTLRFTGKITGQNRQEFNNALNRLLWGFRYHVGMGPNPPAGSGHRITPNPQDWFDELPARHA